jgi:hypothetical protein
MRNYAVINRSYNAKQKVEMEDYRRVAGDSTNTAGDKGQQVSDRAAEVIVPGGQALELVEIMERGLLGRSTISFLGRSHRTENCNSPSKVMSSAIHQVRSFPQVSWTAKEW